MSRLEDGTIHSIPRITFSSLHTWQGVEGKRVFSFQLISLWGDCSSCPTPDIEQGGSGLRRDDFMHGCLCVGFLEFEIQTSQFQQPRTGFAPTSFVRGMSTSFTLI